MDTLPSSTHDPETWVEKIAASLRAERDGIQDFLTAQEQRLETAETALQELIERFENAAELSTDLAPDRVEKGDIDEDYQRRYEMALDDLRDLKASNAVLQEQLSKARATASALAQQSREQTPKLNWEAEKQRILAALESDLDADDPSRHAERIKIQEVLATTTKLLAEKDKTIAELNQKLEKSASGVGAVAVAAAALSEALDHDTAVQDERKRLKEMQEEIQNKLCKAEVEISLERAKLARERVELEERARLFETNPPKTSGTGAADDNSDKPTRSRWMSRLGLTDADRERGRHS
jgi:hypothetical protein